MKIGLAALLGILVLFATGTPPASAEGDGRTLLAVFAHADDEFFVMPLLARYARKGAEVRLVVAANQGAWAPTTDLTSEEEITALRAAEARCSAAALGLRPPTILGMRDGGLGEAVVPPWATLSQLGESLRTVFAEVRPDVVVTWGPDGGYGHPDHRLLSAVVTELVQAKVDGAPEVLLYAAIPSDRMPEGPPLGMLPLVGTDPEYLTVRVPYEAADLKATEAAFACYASQFPPLALAGAPRQAHEQMWRGRVALRPWAGELAGEDVFALRRKVSGGPSEAGPPDDAPVTPRGWRQ